MVNSSPSSTQNIVSAAKCPTPRWTSKAKPQPGYVIAAILAGGISFFVLPYFFPVRPNIADSYAYGFNNRAAVLILLSFLLSFAIWRGPLQLQQSFEQRRTASRLPLLLSFSAAIALHTGLWLVHRRYGPIQEGLYVYDRLEHLAIGQTPFKDFEFAYGALLLYLPLMLAKLLSMSLLSGYSLSLLLEQLAGLALFWYVLRECTETYTSRFALIYLLISGTMLAWVPLAGAQYTALRYWLAPAGLIFSYRLAFRDKKRILASVVLALNFGCVLLVAPEQAIGYIGGAWLFTVLFLRSAWRWLLPALTVFTTAACAVLVYVARIGMLDTFLTIGRGAYSVPIAPSFPVLLVLILLLTAYGVGVEAFRRREAGNVQLLLLCISPFFLPAAFGRCDPEHVISNTLSAALVGWIAIAGNRTAWKLFASAYTIVIFFVPTQLPVVYRNDIRLILHGQAIATVDVRYDKRPALLTFSAPYSSTPGAEKLPYRIDSGRFYGTTDLVERKQVEQRVQELCLPSRKFVLSIPVALGASPRRFLYTFTGGFYFPKQRNQALELNQLTDELSANTYPLIHSRIPLLPGSVLYGNKLERETNCNITGSSN